MINALYQFVPIRYEQGFVVSASVKRVTGSVWDSAPWRTFGAVALVAVGPVDALGSVEAGRAGALVDVHLTHVRR